MNKKALHPNTLTLLSAWERMTTTDTSLEAGPKTSDHPDLIGSLFVIEQLDDDTWVFRNAGEHMSKLLGRELGDHNFPDFWTGHDRSMMLSFLSSVHQAQLPGVLKARGETLTGQRIDMEVTLAPLKRLSETSGKIKLLGLYQTLGGAGMLMGRPVWRHRLTAVYPPEFQEERARLKLVANND